MQQVVEEKFQMLFEQNIASNVTRNVTLKYGKARPSMPKHAQQEIFDFHKKS